MKPKISVIVPCYNVEQYLDRCLNSLVNQTLKEIEIILVDDGSPDNIPKMCDEWALKDSKIKVIHKKNAGLGYARNSGIEIASGEYLAFVDSDDFIEQTMYETLYEIASKNKVDAIFCGFKKEISKGIFQNIQEVCEYTEFGENDVKKLIPDFIASEPYNKKEYRYEMSVWHSVYSHSIILKNKIQFVSERDFASEDIPFQIDFLKSANKVAFVPNMYYVYCWNGNSLTKKVSKEKFEKIKNLYYLLNEKSVGYDVDFLRSKRLFIGYVRAFIRTLVGMNIPTKDKLLLIKYILQDDIWNTMRLYKPSFLPIHQRIFLICIYRKHPYLTFFYAKMMEKLK